MAESQKRPSNSIRFSPLYLSLACLFTMLSSSFAADAAAPVWRRDIWPGGTFVWRYSSTDPIVGGTTRIFCKPSGLGTIRAFQGSLWISPR